MNKLIVMSGVPGSGKSYFSNTLKRIKGSHVYIVSSDQIRALLSGNQQDLSHDNIVWQMYYSLARAYSKDPDGIVILDSTNPSTKYRIKPVSKLKPYFDEVDLVSFKLDKKTVLNQNLERDWPIPTEVLKNLIEKFEYPNDKDKAFFDNIWLIDSNDISPVINKIAFETNK